ncbi:DUF3467 domain-containing protein [Gimesia maris]|jgi:hypothetical protein|uniref:DUF3467 domain-containing protein n=1 Tax=Gimesia maris TaxID=122 RepID=A0ABX5YSA4_9PLAN|nr:DUF3467 domain-containing protein [Gimesia maris]EDL60233.1 hypothetical protein PM8797T_20828 [Gimesia maris DSM 8797]QDU16614.1 hypothetical protein CA11_44460 [Gimesia maris]QEG18654.1 hypothetical protein GmarT_45440 [Gimesia maris]QGQ28400.1 DUF3467 domain-containing protein [Gimesia maris]
MSDNPTPADNNDDSSEFNPERHTQEIRHSQVSARVPEGVSRGVFSTGAVVLQGGHEFILDFLLRISTPQQVVARVVLPIGVVPQMIRALRDNLTNYENRFGTPVIPTPLPPAVTGSSESINVGAGIETPETEQSVSPTADSVSGAAAGGAGVVGETRTPESGNEETSETKISPVQSAQKPPSAEELYDELKLPDEMLSGTYANAVRIGHSATEFSFDFITTFFPRSCVSARVHLAAPNIPRLLDSLTHSFEQFQRKVAQQQKRQPPQQDDLPD